MTYIDEIKKLKVRKVCAPLHSPHSPACSWSPAFNLNSASNWNFTVFLLNAYTISLPVRLFPYSRWPEEYSIALAWATLLIKRTRIPRPASYSTSSWNCGQGNAAVYSPVSISLRPACHRYSATVTAIGALTAARIVHRCDVSRLWRLRAQPNVQVSC